MFKNSKPKRSLPIGSRQNLSPEEGDTIKRIVGAIVDVIVTVTGGKPSSSKK